MACTCSDIGKIVPAKIIVWFRLSGLNMFLPHSSPQKFTAVGRGVWWRRNESGVVYRENCAQFYNGRMAINGGDHTGRSSTSRTDVKAAWAGGTDFGKRMSHSSRFIHCMGIVLWKCSQHGCEYKKPIYTAKTFLNSCQDGTNASILSEIILKNNYIL